MRELGEAEPKALGQEIVACSSYWPGKCESQGVVDSDANGRLGERRAAAMLAAIELERELQWRPVLQLTGLSDSSEQLHENRNRETASRMRRNEQELHWPQ